MALHVVFGHKAGSFCRPSVHITVAAFKPPLVCSPYHERGYGPRSKVDIDAGQRCGITQRGHWARLNTGHGRGAQLTKI